MTAGPMLETKEKQKKARKNKPLVISPPETTLVHILDNILPFFSPICYDFSWNCAVCNCFLPITY